jgi:hypothetical protein
MAIFNSYVSLPEGMSAYHAQPWGDHVRAAPGAFSAELRAEPELDDRALEGGAGSEIWRSEMG